MTGAEYRDLIAAYILKNFGGRSVRVYPEVSVGKSIIGKNRRVDLFVHEESKNLALAVECKFQGVAGTTDEKIPYTLEDMGAMPMPACIVYAGDGWSNGVRHMLEGSTISAHCMPAKSLMRTRGTHELDHLLAQTFGWWDLLIGKKRAFEIPE